MTTDGAREAGADVISSGREPRPPARRPGVLVGLLVVALAVSVAVALHYRTEAAALRRAARPVASPVGSPMPEVTSVALPLPASGGVAGTVVITAAALPGAELAQFTVSAVITGAAPGTFYDLIGNDCQGASPLGNHVWATGLAGPHGTAELVGYAWTGAVADSYWLALDPSPLERPPGLRGQFAAGRAIPFPAGRAPCPSSP